MFTKPSKNSKNEGFIALSIAIWCILVLTTILSLEAEWLFVYIDQKFYEKEIARLHNFANVCLEKAYAMSISGPAENFTWKVGKDTCWGQTGENLAATTTNGLFWYGVQQKF